VARAMVVSGRAWARRRPAMELGQASPDDGGARRGGSRVRVHQAARGGWRRTCRSSAPPDGLHGGGRVAVASADGRHAQPLPCSEGDDRGGGPFGPISGWEGNGLGGGPGEGGRLGCRLSFYFSFVFLQFSFCNCFNHLGIFLKGCKCTIFIVTPYVSATNRLGKFKSYIIFAINIK